MRPHRLTISAFGPFAAEEVVEFDDLAEAGLFTISGRTGAGKTSILDAICFALYGAVPETRPGTSLRSDHAASSRETAVELEFSVGADEYLVHRVPDQTRAAKRGSKVTNAKHKAQLSKRVNGAWEPLTSSVKETTSFIQSVIGLDVTQFQQVVLIPQGRFAEALRAGATDRRALLSSLFATGRFSKASDELRARADSLATRLGAGRDELARLAARADELWADLAPGGPRPEAPAAVAVATDALRRRHDSELAAARQVDAAARAALSTAEQQNLQRERVDAARAEAAELDRDRPQVEEIRRALSLDDVAGPLVPVVELTERARAELLAATRSVDDATLALADAVAVLPASWLGTLDLAADFEPTTFDEMLERANALVALAASTTELDDAVARHQSQAHSANTEADSGRTLLATLGAEVRSLEADLRDAREAEALVPAHRAEADRARARAEAARRAEALDAELLVANSQLRDVIQHREDAAREFDELLRRRLSGIAGVLAAELVEGAPCSVCGSAEHPHPAVSTDLVTDLDLEAAASRREQFEQEMRAHSNTIESLQGSRAELDTGGASAGDAEEDADRAQALLAATEERAERAEVLAASLVDGSGRCSELEGRVAALSAQARDALDAAATVEQQATGQRTELERALGGADPEAVRDAALAARDTARTRHDAQASRLGAQRRLTEAERTEHAALASAGLTSPDAVRAAHLTAEERTAHLERVSRYDRDRARVDAVLDGVSDHDLPESVDTVELVAAVRCAAAAVEESVAIVAVVERSCTELDRVLRQYEEDAVAIGPLVQEWERVDALARTCRGDNRMKMHLEAYVLAAYLEEIVDAASDRFAVMSQGRYRLRHRDDGARGNAQAGLDLAVFDAYTGTERDVPTLSGGETFQASLALALATAEVVRRHHGGVELECLFIDEGFATLDRDVLELALGELDTLRAGGRMVGVISHLRELSERIPVGINVVPAPMGAGSRIEMADVGVRAAS